MEHARVYAQIDLDAVASNFGAMRNKLGDGVKMIAVVKTNAYGHGAVEISRMTEPYDYVWGFAVATVPEAEELRAAGIRKPILILGFVFPEDYEKLVDLDVRPTVFKLSMARQLEETACRMNRTLRIHLAVDTGMSRIGFEASGKGADEACRIKELSHLHIEGMFTHFAKADEADKTFAHLQFHRYMDFVRMLEDRGVSIPLKHVCNSAGIMELPDDQLDMVRAGITIYGIYPSQEVERSGMRITPVMSLISHIAYIKVVPEGTSVSYGGTFVTDRKTRIATIPVGYGDGYPRLLSGKGSVLIRGKRAPIIGRVCMDQFMVDVTDIEAEEFDRVTLLGKDGEDEITVDELGNLSGRFPYEFTCDINPRVPRVFTGQAAL